MEASHIPGGTEDEHSSSESGWTTYIGSHIHENGYYDDADEYRHSTDKREDGYNKNKCLNEDDDSYEDDESDDSMASDASSGPNHLKHPCRIDEQGHGVVRHKLASKKGTSKEKLRRGEMKRDQRRTKEEKEESVMKVSSAASHVKSRAQVRMSNEQ